MAWAGVVAVAMGEDSARHWPGGVDEEAARFAEQALRHHLQPSCGMRRHRLAGGGAAGRIKPPPAPPAPRRNRRRSAPAAPPARGSVAPAAGRQSGPRRSPARRDRRRSQTDASPPGFRYPPLSGGGRCSPPRVQRAIRQAHPHGINATRRFEMAIERDVGGGEAEQPAALVAMRHHAPDLPRAAELAGSAFGIAILQHAADARGADRPCLIRHRGHHR